MILKPRKLGGSGPLEDIAPGWGELGDIVDRPIHLLHE
jgi:hypothetical protein